MKLHTIKLIACDIDGVLLVDTFSPVLRNLVMKFGGNYTAEIERNIFSRPQKEAQSYLEKKLFIDRNKIDLISEFFAERDSFLSKNYSGLAEGAEKFLKTVSTLGCILVCYGGLPREKIVSDFDAIYHYFDRYVCTNDFRPGIKEITKDFFSLNYSEALFIDDVNSVAEEAKKLSCAFIGVPSAFSWGYQRKEMLSTGVKYMVNSVGEITRDLIHQIDDDSKKEKLWSYNA